ncbi:MAG: diaminopimelate epimerase [Deferrisomatales bacterium]|nr:diaminopimelate epimerase [Deferrisomatales bacterium]
MVLSFVKMHGLGNDFVLVDERECERGDWPLLAPRVANRRLGVGCDQVLLVRQSARADLRMDIYNADGSRAEMCGNGIRCLALYARTRGLCAAGRLRVETLGGIVETRFLGEEVQVDMGAPVLEGRRVPVEADGPVRDRPLPLDGEEVRVTCVSMGNPHAVVFVEDATSYPVEAVGPRIETHPFFPRRTNVEFVQVLGPDRLRMRVWERGAGVTTACGTGACAAAVAAAWTGRAQREAWVLLDGGVLRVRWDEESSRVFLTGPATEVFEGRFPL